MFNLITAFLTSVKGGAFTRCVVVVVPVEVQPTLNGSIKWMFLYPGIVTHTCSKTIGIESRCLQTQSHLFVVDGLCQLNISSILLVHYYSKLV